MKELAKYIADNIEKLSELELQILFNTLKEMISKNNKDKK